MDPRHDIGLEPEQRQVGHPPGMELSGVLLTSAEKLLGAGTLDAVYDCFLDGVLEVGISRARLYFCRENEDSHYLELVGASHRGPLCECEYMRRRFEERTFVIRESARYYKAATRCLNTGKLTSFLVQPGVALSFCAVQDYDVVTLPEDPCGRELLKADPDCSCCGCDVKVWLDVPIIVEGAPRGKLSVDKKGESDLCISDDQIRGIQWLRRFAEIAIGTAESRECKRVVDTAEKAVVESLASGQESVLGVVCEHVLDQFISLSGASGGHIRLFFRERNALIKATWKGDGGNLWPIERQISSPLAGTVYLAKRATIINDTETSRLARDVRDRLASDDLRYRDFFAEEKAFGCFPLLLGGNCEGTISLTSRKRNVFAGRQHLIAQVAAAVAPRIAVWRKVEERRLASDRSSLCARVARLFDETCRTPKDRLRTMLVAITSGHGLGYNTCLVLLREPDGKSALCHGAIGFANRADALEYFASIPTPELGGRLETEVQTYRASADGIEAQGFPAAYVGKRFTLTDAPAPLRDAFETDSEKAFGHIDLAEQARAFCDTMFEDLVRKPRESVCLVPLVFSGTAIGVLWLDNAWSGYAAWEKEGEKDDLLEFCRTVVAPTLVFDHFAEPLVRRQSQSLPPNLQQGVYLVDNNAIIQQSTLPFRDMFGGDSRGRNTLELESVTGTQLALDLRRALSGDAVDRFGFPLLSIFGRRLELDYRLTPLRLFGDKLLGVVGVFVDSRAARAATMTFTAALIHGHLHSVSGWIRQLRDSIDAASSSSAVDGAPEIALVRSNLSGVLQQLASVSRASFGMSVDDVDIQRLLQRLAARAESLGNFTVHIDSSNPVVRCSADLLEIAFDNLIMNAYRATRSVKNPELRIGVHAVPRDNGKTQLTVTFHDTGPGISPAIRDALAPTSPPSATAKRAGLGLAITRELVEFVGGRLTLAGSTHGEVLVQIEAFLANKPGVEHGRF